MPRVFASFQREKEAEMVGKKGETEGIWVFPGNGQNYLGDNLDYIGSCRENYRYSRKNILVCGSYLPGNSERPPTLP